MKTTRLAAILPLSLLTISLAQGAQYRVVELGTTDIGQSAFASDINDSGQVSVNIQNLYRPPIDVSLINFELESLIDSLTDIEAAKAGNLNDKDYLLLYSYVMNNRENQYFQQIAQANSYIGDEFSLSLSSGFDFFDSATGKYATATNTTLRGLNDMGYAVGVGQGQFYKLPYTFEDESERTFVLNDFYSRAFAQINDHIVALPPPDTTAGGLSDAFDINANNQVVGYGTTEILSENFLTNVENCNDDTERGDLPVESCMRTLSQSLNSNVGSIAQRRGLIWQLDDQGNLISTKQLGILYQLAEDETRALTGTAVAINDNGIAVGESPVKYQDTSFLTTAAAIYIDDQIATINSDSEVISSSATDINNDDIVVGYITKRVNGYTRRKFFVHDLNTDKTMYPNDFFQGSSSVATSINNNGMVVGYAEAEASLGNRRNQGFIYDIQADTFTSLQTMLACDSEYSIQQAQGINDNNEIIATAVRKGKSKNALGEVRLDEDGVEVEADLVVSVKLVPIVGGTADQCDVENPDIRERQGAGMGWLMLLSLFGFVCRKVLRKH